MTSTIEQKSELSDLQRITSAHVVQVILKAPAYDLDIEFDNGLILRVFCDLVDEEIDAVNYSFFSQNKVYSVGPQGAIIVEEMARDA